MARESLTTAFFRALPVLLEKDKLYTKDDIKAIAEPYLGCSINENTLYGLLFKAQKKGLLIKPSGKGKYQVKSDMNLDNLQTKNTGTDSKMKEISQDTIKIVNAKEFVKQMWGAVQRGEDLEKLEKTLMYTPLSITPELAEAINALETTAQEHKKINQMINKILKSKA